MARERKGGRPESGDAARDGYSRGPSRPRSASPGNFVTDEQADAYDDLSDLMSEFGGREAALRRRFFDLNDE